MIQYFPWRMLVVWKKKVQQERPQFDIIFVLHWFFVARVTKNTFQLFSL